jgi:DNA-binding PadR family transcriptional regulator
MSGYDIKSLFNGLSWLIDTPSYGSLYPTLHSLLEEELVSVEVEPSEGRPPRKLYSITSSGRQALDTWLEEPTTSEPSIRSFVRQLFMASSLSEDELVSQLTRRRSQIMDYLGTSNDNGKESEERSRDQRQQLVHDYGSAIARAELAWLDSQLSELT